MLHHSQHIDVNSFTAFLHLLPKVEAIHGHCKLDVDMETMLSDSSTIA